MDMIDPDFARRDAGIGAPPMPVQPSARLRSRRRVILGAAALVGLALTAGCAASGTRRCNEMVASGQRGHRMKMVPCPSQEPAS